MSENKEMVVVEPKIKRDIKPCKRINRMDQLEEWIKRVVFFLIKTGFKMDLNLTSFLIAPRVVGVRCFLRIEEFYDTKAGKVSKLYKQTILSQQGIRDIGNGIIVHDSDSLFNGDAVEKDEISGWGTLTVDKGWYNDNTVVVQATMEEIVSIILSDPLLMREEVNSRTALLDDRIPKTKLDIAIRAMMDNKVYFVSDKVLDNAGYIDTIKGTIEGLECIEETDGLADCFMPILMDLPSVSIDRFHISPTSAALKDHIDSYSKYNKAPLWLLEYTTLARATFVSMIVGMDLVTPLKPNFDTKEIFELEYTMLPHSGDGYNRYLLCIRVDRPIPGLGIGAVVEISAGAGLMNDNKNLVTLQRILRPADLNLRKPLSKCPKCFSPITLSPVYPFIYCENINCS